MKLLRIFKYLSKALIFQSHIIQLKSPIRSFTGWNPSSSTTEMNFLTDFNGIWISAFYVCIISVNLCVHTCVF